MEGVSNNLMIVTLPMFIKWYDKFFSSCLPLDFDTYEMFCDKNNEGPLLNWGHSKDWDPGCIITVEYVLLAN